MGIVMLIVMVILMVIVLTALDCGEHGHSRGLGQGTCGGGSGSCDPNALVRFILLLRKIIVISSLSLSLALLVLLFAFAGYHIRVMFLKFVILFCCDLITDKISHMSSGFIQVVLNLLPLEHIKISQNYCCPYFYTIFILNCIMIKNHHFYTIIVSNYLPKTLYLI